MVGKAGSGSLSSNTKYKTPELNLLSDRQIPQGYHHHNNEPLRNFIANRWTQNYIKTEIQGYKKRNRQAKERARTMVLQEFLIPNGWSFVRWDAGLGLWIEISPTKHAEQWNA